MTFVSSSMALLADYCLRRIKTYTDTSYDILRKVYSLSRQEYAKFIITERQYDVLITPTLSAIITVSKMDSYRFNATSYITLLFA